MDAARFYTQRKQNEDVIPDNIINYDFKSKSEEVAETKTPKQTKKTGVTLQHTAVNPIKDIEDIEAAKQYFLNKDQRFIDTSTNIRNYALFILSCNCARRVGDILNFTIGDILNSNGTIRTSLTIREQKTNKVAEIFLNDTVKEALNKYLLARDKNTLTPESYLFISRSKTQKGEFAGQYKSITRQQAWRIYKQMADEIGLTDKGVIVGCHTPRKTFVYHQIKNCKNDIQKLVTLVDAMNHSSLGMTKKYAGIQSEEIRDMYMGLEL